MNTKLIAILAVVVVCVAAVGVYVVAGNNGDKKYHSDDDTGRLKVYGNANHDDYLDDKDVAFIEKIIAGTEKETKYADANRDGKVDSNDVQYVKDIIDKKVNKVWISQTYNKEEQIVETKYPIDKIAVAGFETITVLKSIGAASRIVALAGASGDSFNQSFYSDVYDLPKCGPDIWHIDPELLSPYKVDAIISMDSKSYIDNYETFEKAGIDVVRIEAAHATNSLAGIVTIGFLLDMVDGANNLMEFFDGILKNIDEKAKAIADADRKTGLFLTMKYYVEGPSAASEYTGTMAFAGAKTLADVYPDEWGTKARMTFKLGDDWLLKDKYQADFICLSNALGLDKMTQEQLNAKWADCGQYMDKMDCFPEGYFILNSTLSPVLRIAFMAMVMYPGVFGENYAYDCTQQYYDKFITNVKDFNAKEDATWIITSNMITS